MRLLIGLMSGTSMDGIDAALVDVTNNTLVGGITHSYSLTAKSHLKAALSQKERTAAALSQLHTLIGREFAGAALHLLERFKVAPEDVIAIGSHGQTICHDAMADIPYTVQLGCAHTISELTAMTVVADFRTRDLILGGKGAPYAPLYHEVLFGETKDPIAIVNIGGIANVSFLNAGHTVSGFDVGPGNCLMDAWAQTHLNKPYDAYGAWGGSGDIIPGLLASLLSDPYFDKSPPKSIGKEYFSPEWLAAHLNAGYAPVDIQATLIALTAHSIAKTIKQSLLLISQVAICGGGAHNRVLMSALQSELSGVLVDSTSKFGVDPDFLEAMMFAWLADKALNHTPLDLRHITGARKSAILGAIYPNFAGIVLTATSS